MYNPLSDEEIRRLEINRMVPLGTEIRLISIIDRLVKEIQSLHEQLESARFDADPRHGNY